MGEGSARFLAGTALGAAAGFAVGLFAASPTARSASEHTMGGLGGALGGATRFLGRSTVKVADGIGLVLEAGYGRLRGQERYLEREIEELRQQITRLEQRVD